MAEKLESADEKDEPVLDLSPEAGEGADNVGEGSGKEPEKVAKKTADEEEGEGEEDELPSARASFIIGRQKQTIEKLRSKKEDKDEELDDLGDPDDDDTSPAGIKRAIAQGISEALAPVTGALAAKADDNEIADLYEQEPLAKAFDKRIRAVMKMPGWEAVPVVAIYHHLSHKSAQKEGARKGKSADREAAHLRGTGHQRQAGKTSIKPSEWTKEDVDNMSDDDIRRIGEQALRSR